MFELARARARVPHSLRTLAAMARLCQPHCKDARFHISIAASWPKVVDSWFRLLVRWADTGDTKGDIYEYIAGQAGHRRQPTA